MVHWCTEEISPANYRQQNIAKQNIANQYRHAISKISLTYKYIRTSISYLHTVYTEYVMEWK